MSRLLENIIKNVINELAGKLDLKWRALTDKDRTFIKQDAIPLLGVKTADRENFNKLGGLVLTATRRFGRTETPGTETKSYSYSPSEIKNDIRAMLNSLTSVWQPMKKAGYVWLVTTDLKPVLPDAKAKAEKIITRYEFLCIYVSQDALQKNIDPSITGYLYSLEDGALVFDWNNIDASQWKRSVKITTEPTINIMHAPYNLAKFGEKTKSIIDQLYLYFDLDTDNGLGFVTPTDAMFNCELKSVIEWFQKTNNIPITGAWDVKTRDTALAIEKVPYPIPSSAFDEIRKSAQTCEIETGAKPKSIDTIIVPEGGFKKGIVGDLNFWPVQLLMLRVYEQIANSNTAVSLENPIYTNLKRAVGTATNPGPYRGDYGDGTASMVRYLKTGLDIASSPDVIEQSFIDQLK